MEEGEVVVAVAAGIGIKIATVEMLIEEGEAAEAEEVGLTIDRGIQVGMGGEEV